MTVAASPDVEACSQRPPALLPATCYCVPATRPDVSSSPRRTARDSRRIHWERRRTGGGNDTRVAGSQRRRLLSAEPVVSKVSRDTCTWQTLVHARLRSTVQPRKKSRRVSFGKGGNTAAASFIFFFLLGQNYSDFLKKINK